MHWLDILKLAVAIAAVMVPILAGIARLWVAWEGDKRWAKRDRLYDADNDPRWASRERMTEVAEMSEGTRRLVLGHQDTVAAHHDRLIRLEEADRNIMPQLRETLEKVSNRMDDIGTRLARLEGIPDRLASIEKRLDRRADDRR